MRFPPPNCLEYLLVWGVAGTEKMWRDVGRITDHTTMVTGRSGWNVKEPAGAARPPAPSQVMVLRALPLHTFTHRRKLQGDGP